MKGTPMLRNFGVSPLREEEEEKKPVVAQTRVKAEANLVDAANTGNVTVPAIDYSVDNKKIEKKEIGEVKKRETDKDRNPSYDRKEQRRMNRENRRKARAYRRSQRNK